MSKLAGLGAVFFKTGIGAIPMPYIVSAGFLL